MKKLLALAAMVLMFTGMSKAQRAAEYDVKTVSSNRIGVTYNNTGYHNNWGDKDENFSLNGFGIEYIHAFNLGRTLPMAIELGANVNFNLGTPYDGKKYDDNWSIKMRDFNLQVPLNYIYRINISDSFAISPYLGLNFKLHLLTQGKEESENKYGDYSDGDWYSYFNKDDMGDDTWNRFQMGWHVGLSFQYSVIYLGVQYGTDFIPAYSFEGDKWNTGNLKVSLGYCF